MRLRSLVRKSSSHFPSLFINILHLVFNDRHVGTISRAKQDWNWQPSKLYKRKILWNYGFGVKIVIGLALRWKNACWHFDSKKICNFGYFWRENSNTFAFVLFSLKLRRTKDNFRTVKFLLLAVNPFFVVVEKLEKSVKDRTWKRRTKMKKRIDMLIEITVSKSKFCVWEKVINSRVSCRKWITISRKK